MTSAAFHTRRPHDHPGQPVGPHGLDGRFDDLSPADREMLERAAGRIRLRGGPPPAPPGPVKLTDLDRTTDPGLDDIRGAA